MPSMLHKINRLLYRSQEVETSGNPLAHAILRGAPLAQFLCGKNEPNYHYEHLLEAISGYES